MVKAGKAGKFKVMDTIGNISSLARSLTEMRARFGANASSVTHLLKSVQ